MVHRRRIDASVDGMPNGAPSAIPRPLSGTSLTTLPIELKDDIARRAIQLGAGEALSLTCRALSKTNLLLAPALHIQLDSQGCDQFLTPRVVAALQARTCKLVLTLEQQRAQSSREYIMLLTEVLKKLANHGCEQQASCAAVETCKLGTIQGPSPIPRSSLCCSPDLAQHLLDSFPSLTSLGLHGYSIPCSDLGALLSQPLLSLQLQQLDLSNTTIIQAKRPEPGAATLDNLFHASRLKQLSLFINSRSEGNKLLLPNLQPLSQHLTQLRIQQGAGVPWGLDEFTAAMAPLAQLQVLTMPGCDHMLGLLELLQELPQLHTLQLPDAAVRGQEQLDSLLAATQLTSIKLKSVTRLTSARADAPCSWQRLELTGYVDCSFMAHLPLHSLTQPLVLGTLQCNANDLDLVAAAVNNLTQACKVPVRIKVLRLTAWQHVKLQQLLAVLQPLKHCSWGMVSVTHMNVGAADVATLAPLCQACTQLEFAFGSVNPSLDFWHQLVQQMPTITHLTFFDSKGSDSAAMCKSLQLMADQPWARTVVFSCKPCGLALGWQLKAVTCFITSDFSSGAWISALRFVAALYRSHSLSSRPQGGPSGAAHHEQGRWQLRFKGPGLQQLSLDVGAEVSWRLVNSIPSLLPWAFVASLSPAVTYSVGSPSLTALGYSATCSDLAGPGPAYLLASLLCHPQLSLQLQQLDLSSSTVIQQPQQPGPKTWLQPAVYLLAAQPTSRYWLYCVGPAPASAHTAMSTQRRDSDVSIDGVPIEASSAIPGPLPGTSLTTLPIELSNDIARRAIQLGAGEALSLTCRAFSEANLLHAPALHIQLDSQRCDQFLTPRVVAALQARTCKLVLTLEQQRAQSSRQYLMLLTEVLKKLAGCAAVEACKLGTMEGPSLFPRTLLGFSRDLAQPWTLDSRLHLDFSSSLAQYLTDSFPSMTSLSLLGYAIPCSSLASMLSHPQLNLQLQQLDLTGTIITQPKRPEPGAATLANLFHASRLKQLSLLISSMADNESNDDMVEGENTPLLPNLQPLSQHLTQLCLTLPEGVAWRLDEFTAALQPLAQLQVLTISNLWYLELLSGLLQALPQLHTLQLPDAKLCSLEDLDALLAATQLTSIQLNSLDGLPYSCADVPCSWQRLMQGLTCLPQKSPSCLATPFHSHAWSSRVRQAAVSCRLHHPMVQALWPMPYRGGRAAGQQQATGSKGKMLQDGVVLCIKLALSWSRRGSASGFCLKGQCQSRAAVLEEGVHCCQQPAPVVACSVLLPGDGEEALIGAAAATGKANLVSGPRQRRGGKNMRESIVDSGSKTILDSGRDKKGYLTTRGQGLGSRCGCGCVTQRPGASWCACLWYKRAKQLPLLQRLQQPWHSGRYPPTSPAHPLLAHLHLAHQPARVVGSCGQVGCAASSLQPATVMQPTYQPAAYQPTVSATQPISMQPATLPMQPYQPMQPTCPAVMRTW
ncbi:hypothetical protein V8C86DRAFT_2439954 [Haematococcus lacustris]